MPTGPGTSPPHCNRIGLRFWPSRLRWRRFPSTASARPKTERQSVEVWSCTWGPTVSRERSPRGLPRGLPDRIPSHDQKLRQECLWQSCGMDPGATGNFHRGGRAPKDERCWVAKSEVLVRDQDHAQPTRGHHLNWYAKDRIRGPEYGTAPPAGAIIHDLAEQKTWRRGNRYREAV